MLDWMKRHKILTGLLALLLIPVTLGGLNYSGMCIPEGRWLSDEEKIRLAASAIANNTPNHNYLDDYFRKKMGDEAFYRSFDEPDGPKSSYETLYSSYYDPKYYRQRPDGGYSPTGVNMSAEEFMQKNPHCCNTVGSKGHPIWMPGFWDRVVLGNYADVVEVRYTARFLDKEGKLVELKDYTEYPLIRNCGYILNSAPH